ncbi:MAG: hypothetical protein ACTS2F_03935 [Thainema sp.]
MTDSELSTQAAQFDSSAYSTQPNQSAQSTKSSPQAPSEPSPPTAQAELSPQPTPPAQPALIALTLDYAAQDVRRVLEEQREQSQVLTTKLNILFVTNGALLTSLTISQLIFHPSIFSLAEITGFAVSFVLLVRAYLPRQVAVSPNLEDRKFLERYLVLTPDQYQLQMLANLTEIYNANKQRVDDVSQTLKYAAYNTLAIAGILLTHILATYFV